MVDAIVGGGPGEADACADAETEADAAGELLLLCAYAKLAGITTVSAITGMRFFMDAERCFWVQGRGEARRDRLLGLSRSNGLAVCFARPDHGRWYGRALRQQEQQPARRRVARKARARMPADRGSDPGYNSTPRLQRMDFR